ncbi:hypothetical protein KM043_015505 [Ampulex compressa]|nr:hypothetical protein KM043_015505 [Ampulex compressa]
MVDWPHTEGPPAHLWAHTDYPSSPQWLPLPMQRFTLSRASSSASTPVLVPDRHLKTPHIHCSGRLPEDRAKREEKLPALIAHVILVPRENLLCGDGDDDYGD